MSNRVTVTWLVPAERVNPVSQESEPDWSLPPSETRFEGRIWWPLESVESPSADRPSRVVTGIVVCLPYGTPVRSGHRMRVENGPYAGVWHVDGMPGHWSSHYSDKQWSTDVRLVEVSG